MYQNSKKETYCRRWYGCPDSTTIRLNFVEEPGAIPCILRGAPPTDTYPHINVELLLITISFFHLFIFACLFSLVVLAPRRLFTKSQRYGVGYDHHQPYAEFGSNPIFPKKVF